MTYLMMTVMGLLIVAADQISKYLVIAHIEPGGIVPVLDGVVHLTHVHNDGAAFSIFAGQQWLFAVIFAVFAAAIIWEFSKKKLPFTTLERFLIIAIFAGGVGNMIDRLRWGYVEDMIAVEFIDFPVFNVADIFISCGCVLLLVHLIFFNRKFWKDEKK